MIISNGVKMPIFVIDLGTTFLKGISFLPENKGIKILDFLKVPYNPQSKIDLKDKLRGLILALKKKKKLKFKSLIVGMGEGIGKGKIKEVSLLRRKSQSSITSTEFKKILQKGQKESFLEAQKEFNRKKIIVIYPKIKKIIIDGQYVQDPIGMPAKEISLKVINFYLPLDFYETLKRVFLSLKIKPLFYYTPDIISPVMLSLKKGSNIFIDIGGKNTQISLFKNDEIEEIRDFPIGGENFIERISKSLKIEKGAIILGESKEGINLKLKKRPFLSEIEEEIRKSLQSEYKKWENKTSFILEKVKDRKLPRQIYIFGGGSNFLFFHEFKEKFAKPPFCFIIKRISPLDLRDVWGFYLNDSQAAIPLMICKAVASRKIEIKT